MYDVHILNDKANLKDLYETLFCAELKYRSHQWEGACPICGGNDRFRISDDRPHNWYCRQCGESGTAVDLVRIRFNLMERYQFRQAVDKLAELLGETENSAQYNVMSSVPRQPKPEQPVSTMPETPSQEWQSVVMDAVIHARDYLWSKAGINELNYLRDRGFSDSTIRNYWLGFNPYRYTLPVQNKKGEPVKAFNGFWMPTFIKLHDDEPKDNVLMRVKVRMEDHLLKLNPELSKYLFISGGEPISLFCAQYARPRTGKYHPNIMYVEGEFDAMTINQCAGDICKAVTFGSHDYIGKAEQWQSWYRIPENTVICFDNDSDPTIRKSVRKDEEKLRTEIMKAQSLDDIDIRANAPVIRHLPDEYHDWNDILMIPDGKQIIRDKLSEWFSGDSDDELS